MKLFFIGYSFFFFNTQHSFGKSNFFFVIGGEGRDKEKEEDDDEE